MNKQPEDTETIEQIIIDTYKVLTGENPSKDEKDWRIKSWNGTDRLIESVTGDNRFFIKYIQPQLNALESVHIADKKVNEDDWQTKILTAKAELEAYKLRKTRNMTFKELFNLLVTRLKIWR